VVNSPRQLWSVAAYLAVVTEGVFGLDENGQVEPKLPTSLVPMLFGQRKSITLKLADRSITLQLPEKYAGNLLVSDRSTTHGATTTVVLKAVQVKDAPLRTDAPLYAPVAPSTPLVRTEGDGWRVTVGGKVQFYVNGRRHGSVEDSDRIARQAGLTCMSATRVGAHGIESLHSPTTCVGEVAKVAGNWPRSWTAPATGDYRVSLDYANDHGPINTGITAAVKILHVRCDGSDEQQLPIVMPHSVRAQASTWGSFSARAGAVCQFDLRDGFNMSYLSHFAHYTGGSGGTDGPLNQADVHDLLIAPLGTGDGTP
jgi:hypothetical protein